MNDYLRFQGATLASMMMIRLVRDKKAKEVLGVPDRVQWDGRKNTIEFVYEKKGFLVTIAFNDNKPEASAGVLEGREPDVVLISQVEEIVKDTMHRLFKNKTRTVNIT